MTTIGPRACKDDDRAGGSPPAGPIVAAGAVVISYAVPDHEDPPQPLRYRPSGLRAGMRPASSPARTVSDRHPVSPCRGCRRRFRGRPLPVVGTDGTRVFVAANSGRLYGIDASAAKVAWTFKADKPFDEPPTLGTDRLYACDSGSTLDCLDREGKLLWRLPLPEKPASAVRESSGRIYLGTEKGRVYGGDPSASGSAVWIYEAGSPVRTDVVGAGEGVAFGTKDGGIHVLDRAGRLRWSFRMAAGRVYLQPPMSNSQNILSSVCPRAP